jgi:hypothetical protein
VKYRVEWSDGDHYEEDGQSAFSRQHANDVVRALSGTIAGDAVAVRITESDQAAPAPDVRECGAGDSGPRASSRTMRAATSQGPAPQGPGLGRLTNDAEGKPARSRQQSEELPRRQRLDQRGRLPWSSGPGEPGIDVISSGNTAEPSGELSIGDVVVIGEAALAVGRPAGWTPVSDGLNECRADEHGTHLLPDPGWLLDAGT